MTGLGCLTASAEVFFSACAALADIIASSLGIADQGVRWIFSFLLALVTMLILIALALYLSQ